VSSSAGRASSAKIKISASHSGASGFTNGTRNAKQASKKKTPPIKPNTSPLRILDTIKPIADIMNKTAKQLIVARQFIASLHLCQRHRLRFQFPGAVRNVTRAGLHKSRFLHGCARPGSQKPQVCKSRSAELNGFRRFIRIGEMRGDFSPGRGADAVRHPIEPGSGFFPPFTSAGGCRQARGPASRSSKKTVSQESTFSFLKTRSML
jgi:hypothetical protein